ncbi:MAG: hypothetical protein K9H64_14500, partial [Bacteroidales bacterium]|nr:hypothetical protein [Bacteroidales bacterium]MCF8457214.1 hypothetical protein [Bacteroidales bacterium]
MKANYRIVLVLAMLIASLNVFAQQLPFQGKLLENGQPANGSKTFQFSIANGGNNWNEIQTVQVNNGLYAVVLGSVSPLPATLFSQQVALNLVVQVNGNTIDTVQIYPPIEADPTVPSNIKDGVQWSDIQNLPTLDYSPANELQNLALNGSVLSISQGNSVILPPVELPEGMEYSPIDTSIIEDVNQAISTTNLLEDNVWQSFKANHTGKLESVSIY